MRKYNYSDEVVLTDGSKIMVDSPAKMPKREVISRTFHEKI